MEHPIIIENKVLNRLKKIDLKHKENYKNVNVNLVEELWSAFIKGAEDYSSKIKSEGSSLTFVDVDVDVPEEVNLISDKANESIKTMVLSQRPGRGSFYYQIIYLNYLKFELMKAKDLIDSNIYNFYECLIKMLEEGGTFFVCEGMLNFDCGGATRFIRK